MLFVFLVDVTALIQCVFKVWRTFVAPASGLYFPILLHYLSIYFGTFFWETSSSSHGSKAKQHEKFRTKILTPSHASGIEEDPSGESPSGSPDFLSIKKESIPFGVNSVTDQISFHQYSPLSKVPEGLT